MYTVAILRTNLFGDYSAVRSSITKVKVVVTLTNLYQVAVVSFPCFMLKWRWYQREILDSFYEWLLYHYSGLGVRMRIPLYMAISVYRTRMVGSNCLVRFARSAWDEMTSRVDTLRPEIPPALGPSSCHFWTLLLAQGSSGCACPRSPSAELAGVID